MKALKRLTALTLALVLSLVFTISVAASPVARRGFGLRVDGQNVEAGEVVVVDSGGMTLVPLRLLFEQLNGDSIVWNGEERTVTLENSGQEVILKVDGGEVYAIIFNDRTFVPAAFLEPLMDVTLHVDTVSQDILVADNARLDRIVALMEAADNPDQSAMVSDMNIDVLVTMTADGITEELAMQMEITSKLDMDAPFMHQRMYMNVLGEEIVTETYDDGEFIYIVAEGMVFSMPSVIALIDNAMESISPLSDFTIARQYYAGLQLVEDDDTITISGYMTIPEQYFGDVFESMGDFMALVPELLEELNMELSIDFNAPIGFTMVFDRELGLPTYMSMDFDMEMHITIDGESAAIRMVFTMRMPRIEYGATFETVVPAEIVAAAISF